MRIASRASRFRLTRLRTLPQRTNADCILPCWFASSIGITLPQRTNADCINKRVNRIRVRNTLPQRTNADCIYQAQKKAENGQLCLSAQMRIASSSATTYHLILFFASAHKCGLHLRDSRLHGGIQNLCLSAQMRIASAILHKNAISFFADCAVSR